MEKILVNKTEKQNNEEAVAVKNIEDSSIVAYYEDKLEDARQKVGEAIGGDRKYA